MVDSIGRQIIIFPEKGSAIFMDSIRCYFILSYFSYGGSGDNIRSNITRSLGYSDKMPYQFQLMNEANARKIVRWRYDSPYDYYNPDPFREEENVRRFLDPVNPYYEIHDENENLVGFCCFGSEGQVPGGDYNDPALDIGIGMDPDLTGLGKGKDFFTAILNFAKDTFSPFAFRVTVVAFNGRAIRLYEKMGFKKKGKFNSKIDDEVFVQMVRLV